MAKEQFNRARITRGVVSGFMGAVVGIAGYVQRAPIIDFIPGQLAGHNLLSLPGQNVGYSEQIKAPRQSTSLGQPTSFDHSRITQTLVKPQAVRGTLNIVYSNRQDQTSGISASDRKNNTSIKNQYSDAAQVHVFAGIQRNNGGPTKVMAAPIQFNPEGRTIKVRDREKMKAIDDVVKVLSQMGLKDDASSIRQMLKLETPTQSILEYAQKMVSEKMIKFVSQASVGDLQKISQFDFASTGDPAISAIARNAAVSHDQQAAVQLLSEEVANFINEHQTIDFPDFLKNLNQLIVDFEKNVAPGIFANGFIPTLLATLIQVSPTIAESLKKKKGLTIANLALIITDIALLTACVVQAVAPLVTAIPSTASPATPEPTLTQILPTGTAIPIESQAMFAPSNLSMESSYAGLNFGDVNGQPFGSISALDVSTNNLSFILPNDQIASRHNFYYRSEDPNALRGLGLDQQYLIDVFNATDIKGGIIGKLPDGTEVKFINGFWQYNKDGQNYYLPSNVANLEKRLLGYPLLVVDKASGKQLFFGIVDQNGVLLEGSKFSPAFLSTADLAKNLGYTGDLNLIGSFEYDQYGNIVIIDTQGNILSVLPYLNPFAPSPTLTSTATETPTPTPTATETFTAEPSATFTPIPIKPRPTPIPPTNTPTPEPTKAPPPQINIDDPATFCNIVVPCDGTYEGFPTASTCSADGISARVGFDKLSNIYNWASAYSNGFIKYGTCDNPKPWSPPK